MNNIALILLGGSGKRLGSEIPKQFLLKKDIPIYIYAINNYQNNPFISDILLVVHPDYIEQVKSDIVKYNLTKVREVIKGGKERYNSSFNGLTYLMNHYPSDSNVLIADAVRANTSNRIITLSIEALDKSKAVLVAVEGEKSGERIDTIHFYNDKSYLAQTPQGFKLGYIFNIFQEFINKKNFHPTDDINLVEMKNEDYVIVIGEESNYKITTPEDLDRFMKD